MSDIVSLAGWSQQTRPSSLRSISHLRSFSSSTTKTIPRTVVRPVSKSISSSALPTMTSVANAPGLPIPNSYSSYSDEDGNMSTIPDPRSRTMSPANDSDLPSLHHPDLSNEVATLSNKLINAINHQTNLDDTLSVTRHELEASRERVRQLEHETQEHADLLTRGVLIKKSIADAEQAKLTADLTEEKRQRAEIEEEKKEIEQELENLTTALFEEANKMVITAREEAQKEHNIVQRRNDQLKAQLADTESLLRNQQEQLAELKQVMEQMTEERDDQTNATAPSTPGLSKFDSKDNLSDADIVHASTIPDPISPTYPTSFTHLLQTVLRTDLSAYDDFQSLLKMSKNIPQVGSRVSSGSYGNIGLGLGLGGYSATIQQPSNGSTTSLSTVATSPATPTTPASSVSAASANGPNSLTLLKDTKFYKRALAEDIEPTLRLDSAPGLSWLARRTVLNAVCEGSLVVEPMPSAAKQSYFACALCGENRKDASHVRSHRFRTSENDNAQRYPLCTYCLGRVRSTCDFLGFLRILKEGHWRAESEEAEKSAWEESVRLREQMFWCRMGGGVIPAHHNHDEPSRSPRMSEGEREEQERKLSDDLEQTGEIIPKDITPISEQKAVEETPSPTPMRMSKPVEVVPGAAHYEATASKEVESIGSPSESITEETASKRDSTQSTSSLQVSDGEKDGAKRLSITIPGQVE